jgi:hypothetical protein
MSSSPWGQPPEGSAGGAHCRPPPLPLRSAVPAWWHPAAGRVQDPDAQHTDTALAIRPADDMLVYLLMYMLMYILKYILVYVLMYILILILVHVLM